MRFGILLLWVVVLLGTLALFRRETERSGAALSHASSWPVSNPHGVVVGPSGVPVAGAVVRLFPAGRDVTVDARGERGWEPEHHHVSDAQGRFTCSAPEPATRVLVLGRGFAPRVLTGAEFEASHRRVELAAGNDVVLEAVDRDGRAMEVGPAADRWVHARPSVHLGHGVWRWATKILGFPRFLFADLPEGTVRFRVQYLPGEFLDHDTRIPTARFVGSKAVAEMPIGK